MPNNTDEPSRAERLAIERRILEMRQEKARQAEEDLHNYNRSFGRTEGEVEQLRRCGSATTRLTSSFVSSDW